MKKRTGVLASDLRRRTASLSRLLLAGLLCAVLGSANVGCSDEQICNECDLVRVEEDKAACVAACTPSCEGLDEDDCEEAQDRCLDSCDGCGDGLQCQQVVAPPPGEGTPTPEPKGRCNERDPAFANYCVYD